MRFVYFDTETHLIEPGRVYPPLVCIQLTERTEAEVQCDAISRDAVELYLAAEGMTRMRPLLRANDVTVIGHNVAFDLGVLCAADPSLVEDVFRMYDEGRVVCTQTNEAMLRIAYGDDRARLDLATCVLRYTEEDIRESKGGPDIWRLRYRELENTPTSEWPEAAVTYALDDVVHLYAVHKGQQGVDALWSPSALADSARQTRAAWAFSLAGAWGLRVDAGAVDAVECALRTKLERGERRLVDLGINRPDGTRDTKRLQDLVVNAFREKGLAPPLTGTQKVSTGKLTLLQTGDPDLRELVAYNGPRKLLSTFVPALLKAEAGRGILNPGYNVIVNTGRGSCRDPNIQNIARDGGLRECFVPREGCCFVLCDYDTLEMRTLAHVLVTWFGTSSMADAINAGRDLHLDFASLQLGLPYDEVVRRYEQKDPEVKKARQFGKVANFGFPGGLGYAAFVDYAYSWGIAVTEEEAKRLKQLWLAKWPEMRLYFRCVAEMAAVGEFTITQLHSGRYRGRCIYTSACNTFFQGLAADGAKDAFYHVSRACYSEREAPLYGARPVLFIHDEIGCEVPLGLDVDAAAKQLAHIMVERMQLWVPTVQITATPVAATKWSKSAERTLDERGRLIPYVVR